MKKKITFRFVDLDYQLDAVNSTIQLFEGQEKNTGDTIYQQAAAGEAADWTLRRNPRLQIGPARLLKNLQNVQNHNPHLLPDDELLGGNYTIDMETGTGKTYVYLRTILELHKTYGFSKFIIVVPRIAILAGVKKSIDQLTDTFKALYDGLDISTRTIVYNSKNIDYLRNSNFIGTGDLSILIMNKDAFNKTGINLIQQEREGRTKLWDLIKATRPIVIIDEPQLIEGTKTRKSASLRELENLQPLFTLRDSATHKNPYNCIYRLTSYDAYNQNLVKKIRVKTVYGEVPKDYHYIRYIAFTKDLKAKIEILHRDPKKGIQKKQITVQGGESLYELSGSLSQYEHMIIDGAPHKLDGLTIAKTRENLGQLTLFDEKTGDSNWGLIIKKGGDTLTLFPGDCTYNEKLRETDSTIIRYQIQIAIRSHLDTQFSLLDAGKQIKAITLFFIDEVKHVRDTTRPDNRGLYLQIFDEEYEKLIRQPKYQEYFKKYAALFPKYQEIPSVREGYFAIDKNKNIVEPVLSSKKDKAEPLTEDDYKSKEDIERGIDLILSKKEELISFETSLAFIFSHSALREGWDNPNVFTLCTLKQSSNDMAKKQEIGRGLRLPVDTSGNRCYDETVNKLTVVANAYYEDFAKHLQEDFDTQQNFDKDTATPYELLETLRIAGLPPEKITKDLAKTHEKELRTKAVLNSKGKLNPKVDIQKITFTNSTLHEHETAIKIAFAAVMKEKGSRKILIENGDDPVEENTLQSYISEETFKKLLNELTLRLGKRTFYQIQINSEQFIEEAGRRLNRLLTNKHIISQTITATTGEVDMKEDGRTTVNEQSEEYILDKNPLIWRKKTTFQIINYIMQQTRLPRLAIYRILAELDDSLKSYLGMQDVLDKTAAELQTLLTEFKSNNLTGYHVIDNYLFDEKEIFAADTIDPETLKELETNDAFTDNAYKSNPNNRRSLYKYYKTESKGEKEFAKQLDEDQNVLLFTKLHKGGFIINTPDGDYSPDWAVIYKHTDNTKRLYFIVETKIDKDKKDLTDVEKTKIRCGEMHFEAVSKAIGKDVAYLYAKNYRNFKEQIPL